MTYNEFIQNILDTRGRFGIPDGEYKERHHIIPRCVGGTDEEENLIDLYAKEHFEAHKMLALENSTNSKLTYAWMMMCVINKDTQLRYEPTLKEYEQIKLLCNKNMIGENHPLYGSKWYTNGKEEIKLFDHQTVPDGWLKGRKQTSYYTRKLKSERSKNRTWFTNGDNDKFTYECPEGYWAGRSDQAKLNIGKSSIGRKSNQNKHWYNNGIKNIMAYECPEGFIKGALPMKDDAKEKHRISLKDNQKLKTRKVNRGFETMYSIINRINIAEFKKDFYANIGDDNLIKKYNLTLSSLKKYRHLNGLLKDSLGRPIINES